MDTLYISGDLVKDELDGLETFGETGPVVCEVTARAADPVTEFTYNSTTALFAEIASLRRQLAETTKMADSLAALVCRFITAMRIIRPHARDDIRAVIDAVMEGVRLPGDGNEHS